MDASASKKRETYEAHSSGATEDRIGDLPDSVLCHILSFLPTKYAVGTSLLSSRWDHLWSSVTCLDFCDSLLHSEWTDAHERMFMNFVDRVLLHYDASYICKFRLSSSRFFDVSRVNTWISSVVRRNVQELVLDVQVDQPLVFPRSLFNSESLKVLKVDNTSISLPSSICFTSLKVLHLSDLTVYCTQSTQEEVDVSFHVLEEFLVYECQWYIKTFRIYAATLKSLTIVDYSDCIIKVHAESVLYLGVFSNLSCELSLHNPSSLLKAEIDIGCQEPGHHASKLLRAICNVKDLMLTDNSIMAFSRTGLTDHLLAFSNLKHLTIFLSTDWCTGEYLTELLCHFPRIKSLSIKNGFCFLFKEHGWTLTQVPQCFLSHLKLVEVDDFHGNEKDLSLVEVLLKNVLALEKMTINYSSTLLKSPKKQAEVTKHQDGVP